MGLPITAHGDGNQAAAPLRIAGNLEAVDEFVTIISVFRPAVVNGDSQPVFSRQQGQAIKAVNDPTPAGQLPIFRADRQRLGVGDL